MSAKISIQSTSWCWINSSRSCFLEKQNIHWDSAPKLDESSFALLKFSILKNFFSTFSLVTNQPPGRVPHVVGKNLLSTGSPRGRQPYGWCGKSWQPEMLCNQEHSWGEVCRCFPHTGGRGYGPGPKERKTRKRLF